MKILLTTIPFHPLIGGMETVVSLVARELVRLGCEIKVVTATPSNQADAFSFEVIRQPSLKDLSGVFRWADACFLHGPSLQIGWPVLAGIKRCFLVHHIWMSEGGGTSWPREMLRRSLLNRCRNLAVSQALADSLPVPCSLVPNPFDDELFRWRPELERNRDLMFLGRLTPEKGVDLIIEALDLLRQSGLAPTLTVAGDGPEMNALVSLVARLKLERQVRFLGQLSGPPLAEELNRHRIMVVPSRWNEPYGIVALEGIASGCVIVGSSGGGLSEAVGQCGLIFPNGKVQPMADHIASLLSDRTFAQSLLLGAAQHLQPHRPSAVAQRYLALACGEAG